MAIIKEAIDLISIELEKRIRFLSDNAQQKLIDGVDKQEIKTYMMTEIFIELSKAMSDATGIGFTPAGIAKLKVGDVSVRSMIKEAVEEPVEVGYRILSEHKIAIDKIMKAGIDSFDSGLAAKIDFKLPETISVDMLIKRQVENWVTRPGVTKIKTPALRNAYIKAGEAIAEGAAKLELNKRLDIALREKLRYKSNMIAQDVLFREVHQDHARRIIQDNILKYVKVRLADNHPLYDVCDVHANLDKYGLGKGIYRKAHAPLPPFHPHCKCRLVEMYEFEKDDGEDKQAEKKLLNSLTYGEKKQLAVSEDRLKRIIAKPEDMIKTLDENRSEFFKTRKVGGGK